MVASILSDATWYIILNKELSMVCSGLERGQGSPMCVSDAELQTADLVAPHWGYDIPSLRIWHDQDTVASEYLNPLHCDSIFIAYMVMSEM